MPKRLPVLCPQEYDGLKMQVTTCTRCASWQKVEQRCNVYIGCEEEALAAPADVPECAIADRCQHQIQALPAPCPVRARGMVCESVVGVDSPIAFNAYAY
jgi:hypothetical protein